MGMKKIIRAFLCFELFFIFGNEKVNALVPMPEIKKEVDINIVSTATPTPTSILIKPIKDLDIEIKPLATKTPTPIIVTQVVTVTPQPTVSTIEVKPTEIETTTQEPSVVETEDTHEEGVEKTKEKTDSNNWFWAVIIGFLTLILIVQIWSTKKDKDSKDKQNDIQS